MDSKNKSLIILGGGGHARVLLDCLYYNNISIIGIVDNDRKKHNIEILGVAVLGDNDLVLDYSTDSVVLVNAIGYIGKTNIHKGIYIRFKNEGYSFLSVIHPSAVVSSSEVVLGEGVQIMAGSVIQAGCSIGDNTLVNTRASIDHDCRIGSNVHIAPGATLSGNVSVGDDVFIGSGATVIQGIHIGEGSIVAAGAVVIADVPPGVTVMGVPGKVI